MFTVAIVKVEVLPEGVDTVLTAEYSPDAQ